MLERVIASRGMAPSFYVDRRGIPAPFQESGRRLHLLLDGDPHRALFVVSAESDWEGPCVCRIMDGGIQQTTFDEVGR